MVPVRPHHEPPKLAAPGAWQERHWCRMRCNAVSPGNAKMCLLQKSRNLGKQEGSDRQVLDPSHARARALDKTDAS